MPVIRISDYVLDLLKKYAIPLEDNPDSVLRRILEEYASLKENSEIENFLSRDGESSRARLSPIAPSAKISFPRPYAERYTRWIIPSLIALVGLLTRRPL